MNEYDRKLNEIKIACIFDEFSYSCFNGICDFIKIYPDTWESTMKRDKPDLLMVESAWEGNDKNWCHMVEGNNEVLENVVSWCKNNNVPTVFWNKEDPVHFNNFIDSAKLFDYIFTTDESMIDEYKKYVSHENIYTLMFAANPKIHNPIKIFDNRIDKYCFAGTYYQYKYEDRKKRMAMLFDLAIKNSNLVIYDRIFNNHDPFYKYPQEYENYIPGSLNQSEIQLANKGYNAMLNVNIVTESKTMFSRRVFEALASLTPVVSTRSIGITNVFGGLVIASDDEKVLEEEMIKLKDKDYYDTKALKAMRLVLNEHTSINRILYILGILNIKHFDNVPDIALLAIVNHIEEYKRAKEIYERQIYKDKKLYLIIDDEELLNNIQEDNSQIYKLNKNTLNNKEEFIKILKCDYVAVINTKNYYGDYYIKDLVNGTVYSDAQVIGKKSYYKSKHKLLNNMSISLVNGNNDFQYVNSLDLDKCIFKLDMIKNNNIENIESLINLNKMDLFRFGYRYLSIDKFNFIQDGYEIDEKIKNKVNI